MSENCQYYQTIKWCQFFWTPCILTRCPFQTQAIMASPRVLFSLSSVIYHSFLAKRVEQFPVSFPIVLQFGVFLYTIYIFQTLVLIFIAIFSTFHLKNINRCQIFHSLIQLGPTLQLNPQLEGGQEGEEMDSCLLNAICEKVKAIDELGV